MRGLSRLTVYFCNITSGTIDFAGSTIQKLPSFIDFLQGGLEMKMFVAVDFTGSNGVPAPNAAAML